MCGGGGGVGCVGGVRACGWCVGVCACARVFACVYACVRARGSAGARLNVEGERWKAWHFLFKNNTQYEPVLPFF